MPPVDAGRPDPSTRQPDSACGSRKSPSPPRQAQTLCEYRKIRPFPQPSAPFRREKQGGGTFRTGARAERRPA